VRDVLERQPLPFGGPPPPQGVPAAPILVWQLGRRLAALPPP
jgi:hypothetical protein